MPRYNNFLCILLNILFKIKTYFSQYALVDGEIFLGIQRPLREKLEGQMGLAVATNGNASLSGSVWDDAEAQFNNYSYSKNDRIVLRKGKC